MSRTLRGVVLISLGALAFVGSASAQTSNSAFTCTATAGVPPVVRGEGLSEQVGDIVLTCTGGSPTLVESNVPQNNIQIFLNTNITSRLLAGSSTLSEALLLIDEPNDSQQRLCTPGPCSIGGRTNSPQGAGINYATTSGIPNVFQGVQSTSNSISWLGVPIDPPGSSGSRIIRITNVRANANALGVSSTLVPTQIVMFISMTGNSGVSVNNQQQPVAIVQNGLTFSVLAAPPNPSGLPVNLQQCAGNNSAQAVDPNSSAAMKQTLTVKFAENFVTAFKARVLTSNGVVQKQNTPGASYFTESGFYNSAWAGTPAGGAGLADSGTKLIARFNNVPAGVVLYVTVNPISSSVSGATARLISTSQNGANGSLPNSIVAATTAAGGGVAPVTLIEGSGVAVWEVERASALDIDIFGFGVFVAYSANQPSLGLSTVNGFLGPVSTVTTAASGPIPRFADTSTATASFAVTPCVTILTTALPPATTGLPYTFVLSASGKPPYTWSILAGSLPAGLTLASNGVISGIPLPQENALFSVAVIVTDSLGATDSRSFGLTVTKPIPALAVTTLTLPNGNVGIAYQVSLSASGGQSPYRWSILAGPLPAGLTLASNGVISGIPTQENALVSIAVTVADSLGATDSRSFGLAVTKPIPSLAVTTLTLPNGNVGIAYQVSLNASGGQAPYQWSISQGTLPAGLTLNASGLISGTPSAAGTFTFGAQVSDQGNSLPAGRLITITIDPALTPLSIITLTLPDADLNKAYTSSVAATGGKPPYNFSVATGSLPPGITIDASGNIAGAAASAGVFPSTILVQDSVGNKASKAFSITVIAPLSITTELLPAGNVGLAYQAGVAATGGKLPYKFSIASGGLPAGLTMDESGAFTGKPATAGTSRFTVQVTDNSAKTASKTFTIAVVDVLRIVNTSPLPEVVQNQTYSQTFTAIGGTQPYSWSVVGGTLPAGLNLNSATGELSGKPTQAATGSFTVQVKDGQGLTASAQFSVNVVPVLAIATAQLPNGTVGAAYTASVTATGGTSPIQWTVIAGSLPAGVTLSSSGAITGTPSGNGSSSFTIQAADSKTQTDSRSYTVVIGLPAFPTVIITGPADTVPPATQQMLGLNLGAAFPVNLTGTVTMTFTPDSGFDDPAVQFTTGGRSAPFTLAAGDPNARFGIVPVAVQTGTVAGLITLTTKMLAGSVDVTPSPVPTKTVRVAKGPPVIRTVAVTRAATGFDVAISGYATGRDVTSATFHFTTATGVTVQTVDFTQQLSTVFNTWYQSTASQPFGSQFTMTQPFGISGNASGLTAVAVTLNSASGASNTVTASIP